MNSLSVWLAWMLFVPLLPLAIALLWRAWRIRRGELRYVAPWNAAPVPDAPRWATHFMVLNLTGGLLFVAIVAGVIAFGLAFQLWAGFSALTLWAYVAAQQWLTRRARHAG